MTDQTYQEFLREFFNAKDAMQKILYERLDTLERIKERSLSTIIESGVVSDQPQTEEEIREWIVRDIEFTKKRLDVLLTL